MTLQQCIDLALKQNPSVLKAQQEIRRTQGLVVEARAIEAHLTTLFAVADPDYPLLRELRSRSH